MCIVFPSGNCHYSSISQVRTTDSYIYSMLCIYDFCLFKINLKCSDSTIELVLCLYWQNNQDTIRHSKNWKFVLLSET